MPGSPLQEPKRRSLSHHNVVLILLLLMHLPATASAASNLPIKACQTLVLDEWSHVERHIWTEHICVGKTADLRGRPDTERLISSHFLEMILLHSPWRGAIPIKGVRLDGALFNEPIDLENARIGHDLLIERTTFMGSVSLATANLEGDLSFEGSNFRQSLDIERTHISKSLFLSKAEFSENLVLGGINVGFSVVMDETRVAGMVDMNSATVGAHLNAPKARFADVDLNHIKVVGSINATEIFVSGRLSMDTAAIGAHLSVPNAQFANIDLNNIKVTGLVDMSEATVTGDLEMRDTDVRASLILNSVRANNTFIANAKIGGFISMNSAKISGTLDLSNGHVSSAILLKGVNAQDLNLASTKTNVLDLDEAVIDGSLDMFSTTIGALLTGHRAQLKNADCTYSKINMFDLSGSTVSGNLSMSRSEILFLDFRDSRFTDITMIAAKLSSANFRNATISGTLDMSDTNVDANLFLEGAKISRFLLTNSKVASVVSLSDSILAEINLSGSKIGSDINLDGVQIAGALGMRNTTITGTVWMRKAQLSDEADLTYLTVGELWLSGTRFSNIDLTGSSIKGQLALSETGTASSSSDRKLTLRNATAGLIQGRLDAWPKMLDLRGFQYHGLGGFGSREDDMINYSIDNFITWVKRSRPFSTQPYEHLAQLLAKTGNAAQSREILFAAREAEREGAAGLERWLKTASWLFIGHTHRLYYIFFWIGLLVIVGAIIVRRSGEARRLQLGSGIAFSFDRLIPLIKLEDEHYKVKLIPWVCHYFYFHQIMGYLLGSFVIAWISGILK